MAKKGNRIQVILECTEHKASGMPGTSRYITTKNKKNTPDRMEIKKFNPILKRMTVHKEIKSTIKIVDSNETRQQKQGHIILMQKRKKSQLQEFPLKEDILRSQEVKKEKILVEDELTDFFNSLNNQPNKPIDME